MKILIASYPRSGQSYLQSKLTIAFSNPFGFSHLNKPDQFAELNNYDKVITIIRDPDDSITSIVAMEMEFYPELDINEVINKRIKEYIDFYNNIIDLANGFIDFNQINTHFDQILHYVSKLSGLPIINKNPVDLVTDLPNQKFLRSSKNSNNYDKAKNLIGKKDLSNCYKLYIDAQQRCVNLDEL